MSEEIKHTAWYQETGDLINACEYIAHRTIDGIGFDLRVTSSNAELAERALAKIDCACNSYYELLAFARVALNALSVIKQHTHSDVLRNLADAHIHKGNAAIAKAEGK